MAEQQRITDIETFAETFRLRIRLDECHDPIIPGHRGESQLYFDGPELCLMVLDGPVAEKPKWESIKAKSLWIGDKSMTAKGRNVQDVKVLGILPESYKTAIRMAQVRPIRQFSEEHRAKLAKTWLKAKSTADTNTAQNE